MPGRMLPANGAGLLLMALGGVLVGYLVGTAPWPAMLPGVLIGLSMIAFGYSTLRSARRRRN